MSTELFVADVYVRDLLPGDLIVGVPQLKTTRHIYVVVMIEECIPTLVFKLTLLDQSGYDAFDFYGSEVVTRLG